MRLLAHDHVVEDGAVMVQRLVAGQVADLGSLLLLSHFLRIDDLVTAAYLGELLLRVLLLLQVTV